MGKRARICNTGFMPVKKDVGNLPSGKRTSREQESGWIDRARKNDLLNAVLCDNYVRS